MTVVGVHDQFYAHQRAALIAASHHYIQSLDEFR